MRVGGARPSPLITFTLNSKVAVYAPAKWADTLTLFHLYEYMYSVGYTVPNPHGLFAKYVNFHVCPADIKLGVQRQKIRDKK